MTRHLAPLLIAATALRLAAIWSSNRIVADVERYQRVGQHLLDVSWNPYLAPRLYPYPPVWMFVEASAEWLARHMALPFAVVVKLPVLVADVLIVLVLARGLTRGGGQGAIDARAGWLYALSPVALLVGGFHGQFDALPLLFVLLALAAHQAGRADASAVSLAAAIALKSFPVLLLPVLLLAQRGVVARLRYAALAVLPVAVLLLPFALADLPALRRELLAYGGVADFGWIGVVRGLGWVSSRHLAPSLAADWPTLVPLAKVLFLAAYGALLALFARSRARLDVGESALLVLLAFQVLYGAVSAQYLLWVVPLACALAPRWSMVHAVAASLGLLGFYLFLAPGVLTPTAVLDRRIAGLVWALGTTATLVVGAAWMFDALRRRRFRQAT